MKHFRGGAAILVGVLVLAACAADDSALNARVGESESQLVAQLGPPNAIAQAGDARVLSYQKIQTAVIPGSGPTPWDAPFTMWEGPPPVLGGATPPEVVTTGSCTTQYRLSDGRVQSWQRNGTSC